MSRRRVAVVGGGWAGIAAAVDATHAGHQVTLYEMAHRLGGRARTVERDGAAYDNGQHILIGAYRETLALMQRVGVAPAAVLERRPLALVGPDGRGLRLPAGSPVAAFARAVLTHPTWAVGDRLRLLVEAGRWAAMGFRCDASLDVATLCHRLPNAVNDELIEPLCVAALNTPAAEASARVFLRVLRDALFSGAGSADLLLPTQRLGALLPDAAAAWLGLHGAVMHAGRRVQSLRPEDDGGWSVDGQHADVVVLACTAPEAARLAEPAAPGWAGLARGLRYEPIVSVVVDQPGARLAAPMVALRGGPAQFVFDHGQLGGAPGRLVFVASGAARWVEAGQQATADAALEQARAQLPGGAENARVVTVIAERRATFRCTPGLVRPAAAIAPGLFAAGDYVDGPYPATLEGAVRSGRQAAASIA